MNKLVAYVAVIAMLVAVAFATYTPKVNEMSFEGFLMDNHREYSNVYSNSHDAFEFELRRQIFYANMNTIRAHNLRYEAGLETWFMKPTQFTDQTQEEFVRLNFGLAKGSQKASTVSRNLLKSKSQSTSGLTSIDWAKEGALSAVVSQGACGSCWGNSAANALAARINIKYGTTQANYPSRQQITACTPNPRQCGGTGGCEGATAQLAYDYLKQAGVDTEEDYPYTAGSGSAGTCKASSYTPKFSISGHEDVVPNDRNALYAALKEGPVSVSAAASSWSFYGGGIYTSCKDRTVNHAITLTAMNFEEMSYTIENSWGASWGEKGFMRLQMVDDESKNCAIDPNPMDGSGCKDDPSPRDLACGCNGILFDSTYPVGIQKL